MPSQKQVKWSQLKVGITVVIASITLGILIFLMSGTGGWFQPKIRLRSYFDNASGLRVGAPVRLNGVDIGNVTGMRVVSEKDKQLTPVEVTMKVTHQIPRKFKGGFAYGFVDCRCPGRNISSISTALRRSAPR